MNVISGRGFWRQGGVAGSGIASLALSLAAYAGDQAPQPADASSQSSMQTCLTPELAEAPESTEEWLVRSMLASHCYEYQARAVSINSVGVRTLALSHRIQDGVRQQVVQHLDGPSISVERRSQAGRLAWVLAGQADFDIETTPHAWAEHVEANYEVTLENEERVAGRVASRLRFDPHDEQRYAHTWWVDEETGLLLKQELSDPQDHVIETFQMTQLQSPALYEGPLMRHERAPQAPELAWHVGWLPEGFVPQPADITGDHSIAQRFYSDGLSSVSVFAAPADEESLASGAYTLGVSGIAIELIERGDERWQLVAIGELPAEQVRRIVQSIDLGEPAPSQG